MNSASDWLRPPATRTSSPSVNIGSIFRARPCASLSGASSGSPPGRTSGMPQLGQKLAPDSSSRPHAGQVSGSSASTTSSSSSSTRPSAIRHTRTAGSRSSDTIR